MRNLRSLSTFALIGVSILVLMTLFPEDVNASPLPQILEFEDDIDFISVDPEDTRSIMINATIRSPYNRNTVFKISSDIDNGNFWTAEHLQEIYLEPFEEWEIKVKVTAPVGEPADKEVELTLEVTSETEVATGSDTISIRVLPYLSSTLKSGSEYLLDLPLDGSFPIDVINSGNTRSLMGIRVEEEEMGIHYMEQIMADPGESTAFIINYKMPEGVDEISIDVQSLSGEITSQGTSIRLIRDGSLLHVLFERGPFLILLPGPLEMGSVKVMSLGGDIRDIWIEPFDIMDDSRLTIEESITLSSLERRDISISGEGFTDTKALMVQAHGFHDGSRISSNPLSILMEGEQEKDEGIPTTTLMYAGGGTTFIAATLAGTFAYFYSASEVFKYKWLLLAFIPMYSTIHGEKVLDHFFRGRLFEYIKENPGVTFTAIKDHFEVNNGTLTYHLHKLEKEELIAYRNIGKYKLFYADGVRVKGVEAVISSIDREIISAISENPGITSKQLALLVSDGRSERTFSRHIKQLERKGFIISERKNGKRTLYFSGDLERVLIPKKGVIEVSEMTRLDL